MNNYERNTKCHIKSGWIGHFIYNCEPCNLNLFIGLGRKLMSSIIQTSLEKEMSMQILASITTLLVKITLFAVFCLKFCFKSVCFSDTDCCKLSCTSRHREWSSVTSGSAHATIRFQYSSGSGCLSHWCNIASWLPISARTIILYHKFRL